MLEQFKLFRYVAAAAVLVMLTACGGGGGNGNGDGDSGGSGGPLTSLQLNLVQGATWTFFWNTASLTVPQSGSTISSADNGEFTITLGAPVTIAGETAYPLNITGDAGEFLPRWTHVAVSTNGSLLGSTNGINLQTIYDADTGDWVGGGFFIEFASNEAVSFSLGTFNGEYNTASALVAAHSSSDGGCETILDVTICGDTRTTFSEDEYYKEGVGPIGFVQDIFYSSSGGGFFTATTIDKTVELIETSLIPTDGTAFNPPPWETLAALSTPRSGHSAVVRNGEIYVIGGFNGSSLSSVEIYNPGTNQWRSGVSVPLAVAQNVIGAEILGSTIYADIGNSNSLQVFDGIWSTVTPIPLDVDSFGDDTGSYTHSMFGPIVVGVRGGSTANLAVVPTAYASGTNQWLQAPALAVTEWLRPSMAIIGDLMYVIGGFGNYLGDRGALGRAATHNLETEAWITTGIAGMATKRDNNSAAVLDGRIYVFGGNAVGCGLSGCTVGAEYRSAEVYNPSNNTWTPIAAMFTPRKDFDSVVLNGQIYVIGGRGGGEYLGAMERYTPP